MSRKQEIEQALQALATEYDAILEQERADEELQARVAERLPEAFYSELGIAKARLKRAESIDEHLAERHRVLSEKIAYMDEHGIPVKKQERQQLVNLEIQRVSTQGRQEAVARMRAEVNALQQRLDTAEAKVRRDLAAE